MSPGELRRRVSPLRPRTCVGTDAVIKARGGPHGQGASEGLLSYGADECTVHSMEDDPRPARGQSRLPFLQTGNYCSVAFCSNRHEAVSRRVTQQVLRSVILRLRYAHERCCSAVETPTRGFPELGALLAAAGRGVPPPRVTYLVAACAWRRPPGPAAARRRRTLRTQRRHVNKFFKEQ